jgi:hypothetical protein
MEKNDQLLDFKEQLIYSTAFTMLPIFTCSNIVEDKKIKIDNINGFQFEFVGQSLNMGIDLKLFAAIFKQGKTKLKTNFVDLLYACGYSAKEIRKDNKRIIFESLERLRKASVSFKKENHFLSFNFIYRISIIEENIELDLSSDLVKYFSDEEHKTFLNVAKLQERWGNKMFHKKLEIFLNNFSKYHHKVCLKEENILINFGVEVSPRSRSDLKKVLNDFVEKNIIENYNFKDGSVNIIFKNDKYKLKDKDKLEKIIPKPFLKACK